MTAFTLTVALDNAAFAGPGGQQPELARLLRALAAQVEATEAFDTTARFPLADHNGNIVATAHYVDVEGTSIESLALEYGTDVGGILEALELTESVKAGSTSETLRPRVAVLYRQVLAYKGV